MTTMISTISVDKANLDVRMHRHNPAAAAAVCPKRTFRPLSNVVAR